MASSLGFLTRCVAIAAYTELKICGKNFVKKTRDGAGWGRARWCGTHFTGEHAEQTFFTAFTEHFFQECHAEPKNP
jgi:hypothetical protein